LIVSHERHELPAPHPRGSVVSVGVFDGVHLGHQAILRGNLLRAREIGAQPTVVTFREHPKSVLLGRAPRTLTSLEHRLELFRRAGIEHTLVLTFDEELRQIPARDFATQVLVTGLGARKFVLGFDSKFGKDRQGTPEYLQSLGFDVEIAPKVKVAGRAVSSTAIREAVELGDLEQAAHMLGRPVAVYGDVVRGDALGRKLGFPTANLDLHHELRPPPGVYAGFARRVRYAGDPGAEARTRASLSAADDGRAFEREDRHPAVANIGFRPTLGGDPPEAPRVEVHLIDFEGDLYGESIELEFAARLRQEMRFPDVQALQIQIAADVEKARRLLAEQG
jgi:riboflavin kinase/FMN adenylyltransferase